MRHFKSVAQWIDSFHISGTSKQTLGTWGWMEVFADCGKTCHKEAIVLQVHAELYDHNVTFWSSFMSREGWMKKGMWSPLYFLTPGFTWYDSSQLSICSFSLLQNMDKHSGYSLRIVMDGYLDYSRCIDRVDDIDQLCQEAQCGLVLCGDTHPQKRRSLCQLQWNYCNRDPLLW